MLAATPSPVRILVVENHVAVRTGVQRVLDNHGGFESVAVGTGEDALEAATDKHFDLAVVGYELADGEDGLALTRDLRCLPRPPRVLIYSNYVDTPLAALAMVAGADGVLNTARLGVELGQAVRDTLHGRARWAALPAPSIASLGVGLPMEERQLFRMWASGADDADIGNASGLPPVELERRRQTILSRLGRSLGRPRLGWDDGAWPLSYARARRLRGSRA
jgi:DNA-binding NarL/FixJ family response regulator